MKLFYHPQSGNSRRVLLTAAHLQVPLERVVVNLVSRYANAVLGLSRSDAAPRTTVKEKTGEVVLERSGDVTGAESSTFGS